MSRGSVGADVGHHGQAVVNGATHVPTVFGRRVPPEVVVPLDLPIALALAEEVVKSPEVLKSNIPVQITSRDANGFRYQVFARIRGGLQKGNSGTVRATSIGANLSRVSFHEYPTRKLYILYGFVLMPIAAALADPNQNSWIGLVAGAFMAVLIWAITRLVSGKADTMATVFERRALAEARHSSTPAAC